ncbi:MAG TPA: transglycosylase domain-containing protein, partial [Blastocatellia bacterium]|nr:transglycosylase domain-containing protein [Blastocatellia bacterium]
MSDRRIRRRRQRLRDEEIGKRGAAPRSIRLAPEFTHIHLDRRRIFTVIAAVLISIAAIGAFKLHKEYGQYAAIIDERLDTRALRNRAGVYAAPRRVSVGQQISRDELRKRFLRAGYRQGRRGEPADQFSSGVFFFEGDTAQLLTNDFVRAANSPETVKIKFDRKAGGQIIKIEDVATGKDLKSFVLPPESLTAESGATTHPMGLGGALGGVGIQASFEDFPPSLVNALIAIEDRSFFSHRGVDLKAVFRAMWENWRHGEIREG